MKIENFEIKIPEKVSFKPSDCNAQNFITNDLYFGIPEAFNTTSDDCKWKYGNERDSCPDPDINIIMYTGEVDGKNRGRLVVSFKKMCQTLKCLALGEI